MFTNEQWKDVPGFAGYYKVSNMGRFKSVPRVVSTNDARLRNIHGKLLRIHIVGLEKHNPTTRIRFCKHGQYHIERACDIIRDVWGIYMTEDQIVLANEDIVPAGIAVVSDTPNMLFHSMTAASQHFGCSPSSVRQSAFTGRATKLRSGQPVKFRLLTDEEKVFYHEFLVDRMDIT